MREASFVAAAMRYAAAATSVFTRHAVDRGSPRLWKRPVWKRPDPQRSALSRTLPH
jgi:hypothetical protein